MAAATIESLVERVAALESTLEQIASTSSNESTTLVVDTHATDSEPATPEWLRNAEQTLNEPPSGVPCADERSERHVVHATPSVSDVENVLHVLADAGQPVPVTYEPKDSVDRRKHRSKNNVRRRTLGKLPGVPY